MTIKIAIIGSGPSGIYAMDGALKYIEDCQIDIIDRLPTPYGLVRAGVAPDHLGTKNVTNQFEKAIAKGDVAYFGNIKVGEDIAITDLKESYDAVIIATGAPIDRELGIAGEDYDGVYGSAEFVGWYNGHPDHADLAPSLSGKSAVIIGNGNVSLDISRLLAKTSDERKDTDIHATAANLLDSSKISEIYVVGRRGPMETSFTPPELRELGKLDDAVPVIDADLLNTEALDSIDDSTPAGRITKKAQEIFKNFTELEVTNQQKRVYLNFLASPIEIKGENGKVTSVKFEKNTLKDGQAVGTGTFFEISANIVIKAIGYYSTAIPELSFDDKSGRFPNKDGHIEDNVYVVGWGKRGPSGTIPTNRPDSFAVSKKISEEVKENNKPGRKVLETIIDKNSLSATSFEDWLNLDSQEQARAIDPKPREKFIKLSDMLEAL